MNKYLNNPQGININLTEGDIMKNFGNQENLKNQMQYSKELLKDSSSRSNFFF